jgi:secondary thiamine-phosphate synthase enzyme
VIHQASLTFRTKGRGTTDIVAEIQHAVADSGIRQGICNVFLQHTSASLILCENADPDVRRDLLFALERAVPNDGFHHGEGNSDSHTKTSLVGPSVTVIVEDGRLQLGTWQSIFFCEFDGPRRRHVWVKTMAG